MIFLINRAFPLRVREVNPLTGDLAR